MAAELHYLLFDQLKDIFSQVFFFHLDSYIHIISQLHYIAIFGSEKNQFFNIKILIRQHDYCKGVP